MWLRGRREGRREGGRTRPLELCHLPGGSPASLWRFLGIGWILLKLGVSRWAALLLSVWLGNQLFWNLCGLVCTYLLSVANTKYLNWVMYRK